MRHIWIVLIALGLTLAACESKPKESPTGDTSPTAEEPEGKADEEKAEAETDETEPAGAQKKVVVAAEGTKFDPPVEKDQIPDGAYICDMGTVHYAQMEKGEGKCPECGMFLKVHGVTKAESPTAGASTEHEHVPTGDGHEGHDHEGHDHEGHDH